MKWVAAAGYYDCIPDSVWSRGPHWHPETHEEHHKMGRERNGLRHCLGRGCSYTERLVYTGPE